MLLSFFKRGHAGLNRPAYKWWLLLVLPLWIYLSFTTAQLLVSGLAALLIYLRLPIMSIDSNVLEAVLAACLYLVTIALAIGLPWLVLKYRTTWQEIGLHRLPTWTDIWMVPAGLIVYLVMSALLMLAARALIPNFDVAQAQNVGFGHLNQQYEYILAFTTLVIIAPLAEEVLFRGYLFGKLKLYVPIWSAILVTSLLFGFVHGAWNLAVDTFSLSVIMCLLRISTGSLWSSVLLHMTKNGLAFYILFVNPSLFGMLW